MDLRDDTRCRNCHTPLQGSVCHRCGQRVIDKRWTTSLLLRQFFSQLTNIEKGFLYTTKKLFTRPGKLVHDYWNGVTIPYYNPFRYMIIWTTINLLFAFWLGIDEMIQANMGPTSVEEGLGADELLAANQQFNNWMNILVLLVIPIKSAASYLLFRRKKKNYAEHLIMNSFIFGQGAFMSFVTQFVFYLFPTLFAGYFLFYFLLGVGYDSYVFRQTFKQPLWLIVLKAVLIGVIGLAALFLLIFLFSSLILWLT
ncbi:MAG: DUF3667 domain-containing protein [Flavobacteriaceae bacterium]|nr:DUF3667 domain-containing protein [Flavobacteriaceae bacterium]